MSNIFDGPRLIETYRGLPVAREGGRVLICTGHDAYGNAVCAQMTATQARQLAVALVAAADQIDGPAAPARDTVDEPSKER